MSSRNRLWKPCTHVKGKSKKLDSNQQSKRQKEDSGKSAPLRGQKRARSTVNIKPVAKIPFSREDSSSNWKALLQKQGKAITSRSNKAMPKTDARRSRNSIGQESGNISAVGSRGSSQSRCNSQPSMEPDSPTSSRTDNIDIVGETGASAVLEDSSFRVKQEFRALGLSDVQTPQVIPQPPLRVHDRSDKPLASPRRLTTRRPPPEGLNEFGYFSYNHYGILKTFLTPAHAEFMTDTGIIAMDCEMVGVGPMKESALARVSIVNEFGYCFYDKFVKPKVEVTDYRTQFSGIRESDLRNAHPFQIVAKEVAGILKGHILVGHSLKSDLAVLYMGHPKARIRDTAFFFKKLLHSKTPKLKTLVKKVLGVDIQQGEHNSITDAQAAMALYQVYQKEWEISVRQSNRGIDILKLTLEEFNLSKTNAVAPTQLQSPYYNSTQNVLNRDWYDPLFDDFNNSTYYDSDFPPCLEGGCGGGSTGASPRGSPPVSLDSTCIASSDIVFPCHQIIDEFNVNPSNTLPQNLQYVQYHPVHPSLPPPPPTQMPMPIYPHGSLNGGVFFPPISFPPQHLQSPLGYLHGLCRCCGTYPCHMC